MAELLTMKLFEQVALGTLAAGTIINTSEQLESAKNAQNIANLNAENTRRVAEYNAGLAEQAAGQEEAASQLRANEAKRQARLKQSRVLALVSASGGNAMDSDIMNIIAGFESEGDLEARTELYQGSVVASNLRSKGKAGIWQGQTESDIMRYRGATEASNLRRQAVGTILGGASSLASKYGAYKNA